MEENFEGKGRFKFPKEDRLHHRSLVEKLFRLGKSFYEFPFRVNWRLLSEEELQSNFRNNVPDGIGRIQMMVTVPKKKRRKAVDRVLMRRRIREAYRLNRQTLQARVEKTPDIRTLCIALVYIHDKNLPYGAIEDKMKNILLKIQTKINSSQGI